MPAVIPPREVVEIAERLEGAGFETWCVGGAVRDALLGHPDLDWDLATAATPEQVQRLFRRTVPVGVRFGTVGVLDRSGRMHEVTTFRRDVETDGRHAVVEFGRTIEEDLARRDFTVNAIAYSPRQDRLLDPFGGREDLERRLIRAVGVPDERMREDRLRALRAIRFAARFGFAIEPATWRAIVASAPHLTRLSPERVSQELKKTMEQVERPSRALRQWKESGALAVLVPPLASLSPLVIDALDYLPRPVLPGRPQRLLNRLAMLFLGLDGAAATTALRGLRFSNDEVRWIADLADRWHRIGPDLERAVLSGTAAPAEQLRRWAAAAGRTRLAPLLRLAAALWAAKCEAGLMPPHARRIGGLYREAIRVAYRDPIELADLAVGGDDLVDADVPPGPRVGQVLKALLDRVLADPSLNNRERLLALVPEILREL